MREPAEPEGRFGDAAAPRARCLAALPEPVVVRKFWPGRSRSVAIAVSLITGGNGNLAQVEIWRVDSAGRLCPSATAIPLSIAQVPELAAALVAAHRRAAELSLTKRRGDQ
jgi:hypothetical protein